MGPSYPSPFLESKQEDSSEQLSSEDRSPLLTFDSSDDLPLIFGPHDSHLKAIEKACHVSVLARGSGVVVLGEEPGRTIALSTLSSLRERARSGLPLSLADVEGTIRLRKAEQKMGDKRPFFERMIKTKRRLITPRSKTQHTFFEAVSTCDLVFAIGPAGTGKTYLAVASAVEALLEGRCERIILSRPAVEAGERLGFLPGDMKEKIDPYLRPLYDALYDMLPENMIQRYLQEGILEIAPLAFMRGRTLANAFIILDEGQNASPLQMKMFLTRLGEGSKMIVTGDPTQIDLPQGMPSGLFQALSLLKNIPGLAQVVFDASDIVRHPLVTEIVRAYEAFSLGRKSQEALDCGF